jgi:hypothetical protein
MYFYENYIYLPSEAPRRMPWGIMRYVMTNNCCNPMIMKYLASRKKAFQNFPLVNIKSI